MRVSCWAWRLVTLLVAIAIGVSVSLLLPAGQPVAQAGEKRMLTYRANNLIVIKRHVFNDEVVFGIGSWLTTSGDAVGPPFYQERWSISSGLPNFPRQRGTIDGPYSITDWLVGRFDNVTLGLDSYTLDYPRSATGKIFWKDGEASNRRWAVGPGVSCTGHVECMIAGNYVMLGLHNPHMATEHKYARVVVAMPLYWKVVGEICTEQWQCAKER